MLRILSIAALALLPAIYASPTPPLAPAAAAHLAVQPRATPPPESGQPTRTLKQRGVVSDVQAAASDVSKYANGVLSSLGSAIPSYVTDGVPNFFQDFPTGDSVKNSLGLNDSEIAALPTKVLNVPSYANWTNKGWNLRFRANVYKQPNISESKLDDLANGFLVGTSIQALPPAEQTQARNLTAEIYVLQQSNQNVTFSLAPAPTAGASGEPGGGGAVSPQGGNQVVTYPVPTTNEGDIDGFVQINNTGLQPGDGSNSQIQRLNVYAQGDINGNATSYLVPSTGISIISDIDDILRVTRIYQPADGLLNSFAKAFVPWQNMPDIYANWSKSLDNFHFHYLTTTPEQITPNYMDFIYKTYPGGSFDTRPLNFSDVSATLSIRKYLLEKVFQTFPHRKFILMADTSNSDVMKDYPAMATEFPGQVQCIFLRNTSATDSGDHFPYDTSGFQNLPQSQYMFFVNANDLTNLDISNGNCYNASIKQNVTFGYQGLPFGFGSSSAANSRFGPLSWNLLGVLGLAGAVWTLL